MKYLFIPLLYLLSTACVKTVDVTHNKYDTIYLSRIAVDTFHTLVVRTDTVTKTLMDTVVQVKHDTMFITKTHTDTLFRTYIDTVYLTTAIHDTTVRTLLVIQHDTTITNIVLHDTVTIKQTVYDTLYKTNIVQVHDTVSKNIYLHDTINNFVKVFVHDTVIRINTIVERDTVTKYESVSGYPTPATDSVTILVTEDSGVNILQINFSSYIPNPDGSFQYFSAPPRYVTYAEGYKTEYNDPWQGLIITAPRMLAYISVDFHTPAPKYLSIVTITPVYQAWPTEQWLTKTGGGIGYPADIIEGVGPIPMSNVQFLSITNNISVDNNKNIKTHLGAIR